MASGGWHSFDGGLRCVLRVYTSIYALRDRTSVSGGAEAAGAAAAGAAALPPAAVSAAGMVVASGGGNGFAPSTTSSPASPSSPSPVPPSSSMLVEADADADADAEALAAAFFLPRFLGSDEAFFRRFGFLASAAVSSPSASASLAVGCGPNSVTI